MVRFIYKKKKEALFPSLVDSLGFYKDAIVNSIEEEDLETASINLKRLISVLEFHSLKENRLNKELDEIRKRSMFFQALKNNMDD